MKVALTIQQDDGNTVVFFAHEILEIAMKVMQELHNLAVSSKPKMSGPDTGEHYAPIQLQESPMQWIIAAASLKQGATKETKVQVEKNAHEFNTKSQLKLIEYYRQRINDIENVDTNPNTQAVWNYRIPAITQEVKKLNEKSNRGEKLDNTDYKTSLATINQHLSQYDLMSNNYESTHAEFFSIFKSAYKDKCQTKANEICLTYNYSLIHALINLDEMIRLFESAFLKKTNENVDLRIRATLYCNTLEEKFDHDEDIRQAISNRLKEAKIDTLTLDKSCINKLWNFFEKKNIVFYADNQNARFNACAESLIRILKLGDQKYNALKTIDFCYFTAYLSSELTSRITVDKIENLRLEIDAQFDNINEISKKYQDKRFSEAAISVLLNRQEMYSTWNTILFADAMKAEGLLPDLSSRKNLVGRLFFYIEFINENLNSIKINSPFKCYTLLQLLVRNGENITDCKPALLTAFIGKIKNMRSDSFDLCVETSYMSEVAEEKELNTEEPRINFYLIGDRVIGINQHHDSKGRYVYDYGSSEETLAARYFNIKNLEKDFLKKLNDQSVLCVSHIELITSFLSLYESEFLTVLINANTNKEMFVEIQEQKVNYKDLEKINSVLSEAASIFTEEELKISYIHKIIEIYIIVSLCREIRFNISMQNNTQRNNKIVTYPQIYKSMPRQPSADIARFMRRLLSSKLEKVSPGYESIAILTAVWFLAETSRNPMTFMFSLMMLDIVEQNLPYNSNPANPKFYQWKQILWNAETVDEEKAEARRKNNPQAEGWGGKHPMCHIGSYIRYFENDLWPLSDPLEQVRQKEASLLINWLKHAFSIHYPNLKVTIETTKDKTKPEKFAIYPETFFSYKVNKQQPVLHPLKKKMESHITELLKKRMSNFDNHLSSNRFGLFWCKSTAILLGIATIGLALYNKDSIKKAFKH